MRNETEIKLKENNVVSHCCFSFISVSFHMCEPPNTSRVGLTENGGPEKGGPMKNNRCERKLSNDRKMQDHDNWKVRRWKMEDHKMEDQLSFV